MTQFPSVIMAIFLAALLPRDTLLALEGAENLSTKHPFFKALALPPSEVVFHSIISTTDAVDYRSGSDGVVAYSSSRLEGVASETIVLFGHGCLEDSRTVAAVIKMPKDTH